MSTTSSFIKEVVDRLKGDNAGVIAAKNERKATSAIKGQLAALEALLVDQESAIEDAEEALNNALYPTTLISGNSDYIYNITNAQERLDLAKLDKEETLEAIKYFTEKLSKF